MLYLSIIQGGIMHTTHLRKVGGSVMLAVPPALLKLLNLQAGAKVDIDVEGERLVVEMKKPRYSLAELLAQCDPNTQVAELSEDREWIEGEPVGRELV
jgi:antitoxin ChpS